MTERISQRGSCCFLARTSRNITRNEGVQWIKRKNAMPEVYVHAVEGRTLDQKRALVKDITDAVVRNFAVPADAVMVQIMESPKTDKAKGGVLFSDRDVRKS
jgi:4-oxalocrotonate tautomerase